MFNPVRNLVAACLLLAAATAVNAFELLHSFDGQPADGEWPYGELILDGSTLYGMTERGGVSNNGVVFSIPVTGGAPTLLHSFAGQPTDGAWPYGSLILDGGVLYGMTCYGGANDVGVIFKVNTDGSGFELLHEFTDGNDDGANPFGSLILDGGTLYGMTQGGSDYGMGVVFKINTDGSGFGLLHKFQWVAGNCTNPRGSLVLNSGVLYGMTSDGGTSDCGAVFKINTDGSGFSLIHHFAGGVDDGAYPFGSLILDSGVLYGMTSEGGDNGIGVIFKINTDGSGFSLLHEFAGGADDGGWPYGDLTLSGANFYGMTSEGGDDNNGVIFKIGTDGSGFSLIHEFAGGAGDGECPDGSLIISGGKYYGMTIGGGDSDSGVVFTPARGFRGWSSAVNR